MRAAVLHARVPPAPPRRGRSTAKKLFSNLLDVGGRVEIEPRQVVVTLDKRTHNPYLVDSGLADEPMPMPWVGRKKLVLQFA